MFVVRMLVKKRQFGVWMHFRNMENLCKHGHVCCPHCADDKLMKERGKREREANEIKDVYKPLRYITFGVNRYYF